MHQSGPQPGSPWDCPNLCLIIIQTLHAITLQEGKEEKEKEKEEEEEEEENTEASENWKNKDKMMEMGKERKGEVEM